MKTTILLALALLLACTGLAAAGTPRSEAPCRDAIVAPLWGTGECPDPHQTIERHTDGNHICRCSPEAHEFELNL